ncbi:hypothetical protein B0H10DRAFT_1957905 [Mycena sp. CBHHK59/15]|nr:hypothetical protein B0H10DRAFT_1957905 [Mycena sp. CBHHK59/15]
MNLVDDLRGISGPWICLEPKPVLNTNSVMSQLMLDAFPMIEKAAVERYIAAVFATCEAGIFNWRIKGTNGQWLPNLRNLLFDGGVGTGGALQDFVAAEVAPVVALDLLMFAVGNSNVREPVERDAVRPKSTDMLRSGLIALTDWYKILESGRDALAIARKKTKAVKAVKATTAPASKKLLYLQFLKKMGATEKLGSKSIRNIRQVSFVLGFYLSGEYSFTPENLKKYAIKDALAQGVKLSDAEATDACRPLLLRDKHSFSSQPWLWRSAGNVHRLDPEHPLTVVERVLWRLIVQCALYAINAEQVLGLFFDDADVKAVLSSSSCPGADALIYASDAVDLRDLIALEEEFLAASDDPGASAPVAPSESSPAPTPTLTPLTAVNPVASASPTEPLTPLASDDDDDDAAPEKKVKAKAEPVPFKTQTRGQLGAEVKAPAPFISPAIPKAKAGAKAGAKAVTKAIKHVTIEDLEEEEEEEEEDESEQGPYDPLYANNWVELFDSSSPLARVPTDQEKVEDLLQPGRKFDKKGNELKTENPARLQMGEARPCEGTVQFKIYCPQVDVTADPICQEHAWPIFENTPHDRETLEAMFSSEKIIDGRPLHCLPSARNLDPDIQPSETQSAVAVTTKAEFEQLDASVRHSIFRRRSVLVLDIGAEPAPKFNRETMERYRNVDEECEIQDCGLRTESSEEVIRVGTLNDLLNKQVRPGGAILNALQNTQESTQIPLPPGWYEYATHERAVKHTESIKEKIDVPGRANSIPVPAPAMPWSDLRWVIIALQWARSGIHQDVLNTVIQMLTGWKLWAIGVKTGANDAGNFSSRHGFSMYDPQGPNTDWLRWEFLLIGPNMCLFMGSAKMHFVISLTDCIGMGHHGHCAAEISPAVHCTLHNVLTNGSTTNADHDTARHLLVRIGIFQSLRLLGRSPGVHVPDLTIGEQVFDLVNLLSFVPQYLGWEVAYARRTLRGAALLMAGYWASDPIHRREDACSITGNYSSFAEIIQVGVAHMAASLVRYRQDWKLGSAEGFTVLAFETQLGRALAAFESFEKTKDPTAFSIGPHVRSELRKRFRDNVKSADGFDFFLPWTATTMPCSISARPEPVALDSCEMEVDEEDVVEQSLLGAKRVAVNASPPPGPRKKQREA